MANECSLLHQETLFGGDTEDPVYQAAQPPNIFKVIGFLLSAVALSLNSDTDLCAGFGTEKFSCFGDSGFEGT
ncbi:unnamed protein product [Phytophthora fragariaefolia]|uniref:Unnamed protein product n=1 Tax=Phytophthora fragariaefolia TaxID=1490495 RepID=A0A9W7CRH9_9STRA|nr:unnamed protein product [Phytophthora fragariaefolia]